MKLGDKNIGQKGMKYFYGGGSGNKEDYKEGSRFSLSFTPLLLANTNH